MVYMSGTSIAQEFDEEGNCFHRHLANTYCGTYKTGGGNIKFSQAAPVIMTGLLPAMEAEFAHFDILPKIVKFHA